MGEEEQGSSSAAESGREDAPTAAQRSAGGISRQVCYCSFCGRGDHEVWRLIAGPTAFICNECVVICVSVLLEQPRAAAAQSSEEQPTVTEGTEVVTPPGMNSNPESPT